MIAGIILAGGRSIRMGREKAFVEIDGAPLLAHVIARLAPQVDRLALNANGDPARFAAFGLPVLPDGRPDRPGPLAGIVAGLCFARAAGADTLAIVPCDCPFVPANLVQTLRAGGPATFAQTADGDEPLHALLPIAALPTAAALLAAGEGSARALHRAIAARAARFEDAAAFRGFNTPDEIAASRGGRSHRPAD